MPLHAVPPADQLHQSALAVDEGDRYAIDLWLHPYICLAGQPAFYSVGVGQLVDAGMRHGVRDGAASAEQWGWVGRDAKALLQVRQALAALVIELIGYERNALAMVVVVPVGERGPQLGHFSFNLLRGPAGALAGPNQWGLECEQYGEQQHERHSQHPCMAGGSFPA
ncbi:hypothetical protein D3C81_502000 [compost metagenome]